MAAMPDFVAPIGGGGQFGCRDVALRWLVWDGGVWLGLGRDAVGAL